MIIEGIPSFILGIIVFFWLPNDPATAWFLTKEERELMEIRHTREYAQTASSKIFSKKDMMKAFKDWKVWAFSCGQFGADTMLYGEFIFYSQYVGINRN